MKYWCLTLIIFFTPACASRPNGIPLPTAPVTTDATRVQQGSPGHVTQVNTTSINSAPSTEADLIPAQGSTADHRQITSIENNDTAVRSCKLLGCDPLPQTLEVTAPAPACTLLGCTSEEKTKLENLALNVVDATEDVIGTTADGAGNIIEGSLGNILRFVAKPFKSGKDTSDEVQSNVLE